MPVHTVKWKLRLNEQVAPDGMIADEAVERLVKAVAAAGATARRWHAAGPLAFATTVVRNAPNRHEVLQRGGVRTGIRLCTLPGETEAELTFLAARRWLGWKAGPLALLGHRRRLAGGGLRPGPAARLRRLPAARRDRLTQEYLGVQDPPGAAELKGAAPPCPSRTAGR